uniref:Cleavage stimulation factor 50 kDa subunit n=1 Tax=Romanomermis culicivorax TaxID=13658 RepID=A0A915KUV1_ROMCU
MRLFMKDRDYMYRLMISQLYYDGYQQVATSLSQVVNAYPPCPPSDKLFRVTSAFKQQEEESKEKETIYGLDNPSNGLDLEFDADIQPNTPEPALYETIFLTAHKGPARASAFNAEGTLVATGSCDASIKIMDVERILSRENLPPEIQETNLEVHPVIRTLYDHIDEVNCVAFHPREQILASGSKDSTLKFFDFSKASVKRAYKTIFEVESVRCLAFHPGGDYILVGTQHPT